MSELPFDDASPAEAARGQVEEPASTGIGEVDAALAALRELVELPVAEHVAVYEQVHGRLRAVLAQPRAE